MRTPFNKLALASLCAIILSGCGEPDAPTIEIVEKLSRPAEEKRVELSGDKITSYKISNLQCKRTEDTKVVAFICAFDQEIHIDELGLTSGKLIKSYVSNRPKRSMYFYRDGKWIVAY